MANFLASVNELAAKHRSKTGGGTVDRAIRARQILRFLEDDDANFVTHRKEARKELESIDPGLLWVKNKADGSEPAPDEPPWMPKWTSGPGVLRGYIKQNLSRWISADEPEDDTEGGGNEAQEDNGAAVAGTRPAVVASALPGDLERGSGDNDTPSAADETQLRKSQPPAHSGSGKGASDMPGTWPSTGRPARPANQPISRAEGEPLGTCHSEAEHAEPGLSSSKGKDVAGSSGAATGVGAARWRLSTLSLSEQPGLLSRRESEAEGRNVAEPSPAAFSDYVSYANAMASSQGVPSPELPLQPAQGFIDPGWYDWYRKARSHHQKDKSNR
ncbi:hypothetical protein Ct61P_15122 [Colletotrichum tofieldiae]|nr:hypothetical protein Ct61P_15122 [Colletotrichum tofieldiae]